MTEADLHNLIKESVKAYLNETKLPQYEQPIFLDCTSKNDADMAVELAYSPLQSSLFYVGECGGDGYKALEKVVEYLEENNIIDNYEADEELVNEYPDDFIEVNTSKAEFITFDFVKHGIHLFAVTFKR